MSGLRVMGLVALREIKERGRSRAYLITTGVVVLIVLALIVVPPLLDNRTDEATVGLVGEGGADVVSTAVALANAGVEPGEDPVLVVDTVDFADRAGAESALESGDVDAVLVDGAEVIVADAAALSGSIVNRLQRAAAAVEIDRVLAEQGQAAADVIEIFTSDALATTTLSGEEARDESETVVAYAGMMLLYIAILLYGTWILTGVTEEKSNRVVEVLLSSIRPWQILGGKILGIGALAIAQLIVTITLALVALQTTGAVELPSVGVGQVASLLLWFVLGFVLFAVMFGAAGSLVSRMEDAQTIAFPMSLAAVVGFFFSVIALEDPTGTVAVVGTFVPFSAPFVVPVRTALDAIPLWEYLGAIVVCAATIGALTAVGGRIYAGGLLRYGGRVRIKEAWRSATE